jgi:glycosyltransferase involved in cell wall biosynthesis
MEEAKHLMSCSVSTPDPAANAFDFSAFEQFRGQRFLFAAGHFDYFGGAERQALYLAHELISNLQADVKFLGWGGNGRLADEVRAVGGTPVVYPFDVSGRGWSHVWNLAKLARFIRRELRPNYILPYVWIHSKVLGAIWRFTGARFCWWNQRDEGRGIQGTRLERHLLTQLPAVVSNSWEGRDFLVNRFQLPPGRVQVINNGVRLPALDETSTWRKQAGIPDSAFVITMLANLTRFKDHPTLLRAFALARNKSPDTNLHLVFAGAHSDATPAIKSLAWDLGLYGYLHLPGAVQDTNSLLRASNLVVHSSKTEGCPNGALEAMALALPVLGTNISGLRQALGEDAVADCLCAGDDWQGLAERILARVEDRQRCREEGMRNRERIAHEFSCHRMATRSLQVIAAACCRDTENSPVANLGAVSQ